MIGTHSLHTLIQLADTHDWRLALVGDPRQLQAVGRGGMFNELCTTARSIELEHIHRFTAPWEAAASLKLRHGDPAGLDAYFEHGRVIAGTLAEHTTAIATEWITHHTNRDTVAITTCANEHVDAINAAIQTARLDAGHLNPDLRVAIGGGEHAHPGDVVATRRNDRHLVTDTGEPVRNRELWTVTATHPDGELTVTHLSGHGTVTLPADYARHHVRFGYAATEHGNQSDTVTASTELVTPATTRRGLYVGVTRGQQDNTIRVVTDTHDLDEARDVLEAVLATDRADVPAVTQRRQLAAAVPPRTDTATKVCDPELVRRHLPPSRRRARRRPRRVGRAAPRGRSHRTPHPGSHRRPEPAPTSLRRPTTPRSQPPTTTSPKPRTASGRPNEPSPTADPSVGEQHDATSPTQPTNSPPPRPRSPNSPAAPPRSSTDATNSATNATASTNTPPPTADSCAYSTTTRPPSLTLSRPSMPSTPGSAGRPATRSRRSNSSTPSTSSTTPTEPTTPHSPHHSPHGWTNTTSHRNGRRSNATCRGSNDPASRSASDDLSRAGDRDEWPSHRCAVRSVLLDVMSMRSFGVHDPVSRACAGSTGGVLSRAVGVSAHLDLSEWVFRARCACPWRRPRTGRLRSRSRRRTVSRRRGS